MFEDDVSEASSGNFNETKRSRKNVINRKHRHGAQMDTLSQSSESVAGARKSNSSTADIIHPMMKHVDPRLFNHPYVSEISFTTKVKNTVFEMLEVIYFFFADLIEGILNILSRLFCGCFTSS